MENSKRKHHLYHCAAREGSYEKKTYAHSEVRAKEIPLETQASGRKLPLLGTEGALREFLMLN